MEKGYRNIYCDRLDGEEVLVFFLGIIFFLLVLVIFSSGFEAGSDLFLGLCITTLWNLPILVVMLPF